MLKYINIEQVSTTVVISGDAISAGSSFNFFASSGKLQPSAFDSITVIISVKVITIVSSISL